MPTADETALRIIRNYCGWHVTPVVAETLVLDGNGTRRIALPSMYVLSVTEVLIDGTVVDPSAYRWSADGWLTRHDRGAWPDLERCLSVTLEHGFEFDDVVVEVARAVAARLDLQLDGISAGETIGPFKEGLIVSNGEVRTVGLLASEKEALAPYRLGAMPRV